MGLPPYFGATLRRTLRALAGGLDSEEVTALARAASIAVRCAESGNPNARAALYTFIELAARTFGEFTFDVGDDELARDLRARALAVNPNVRLDRPRAGATRFDVVLFVDDAASFWSSGWWFGRARPPRFVANPLGATAAGILAYSELGKVAFGSVLPMARPIAAGATGWSLLDYAHRPFEERDATPIPEPLDLGALAFVGLGAVGQAAVYTLARLPLSGEVNLIDPQVVTRGNLQRYLTATMADVGTHKVALARRALGVHPALAVRVHVCTWRRYLARAEAPPTVVVGLDSASERRVVQASLPELIFNGWTRTGAAGCMRIVFDSPDQCLACSYLPRTAEITSDFAQLQQDLNIPPEVAMRLLLAGAAMTADDLEYIEKGRGLHPGALTAWKGESVRQLYGELCGAAVIANPAGEEYVVPLAQASATAGLLLAVELCKHGGGLEEWSLRDRIEIDLLQGPGPLLLGPPWLKSEHPVACICKDSDYLEVFRERWRMS